MARLRRLVVVTLAVAVAGCAADSPLEDPWEDPEAVPAAQWEAIADRSVTDEEYREAVTAERDCLLEAGVFTTVTELQEGPHGDLEFEAIWDEADDPQAVAPEVNELNAVSKSCADEHSRFVVLAWSLQ